MTKGEHEALPNSIDQYETSLMDKDHLCYD